MAIGFIGLGIMGRPMAKHLLGAGEHLLVSDLSRAAVEELTALGADEGSYQEIGRACDVIFTMLPSGSIVQQVLFGESGVAAGLSAGKLVCDMSSVTPSESRCCFRRLREEFQVDFVDAPVSGGEPGAVEGTLAIMCGGEEAAYRRLLPYFALMGASSALVGPAGAGSVTKLANQIIVNMGIAAVSEALVLATKAGSAVLEAKAPMMCARNFKPGGKISINHKDIKNVMNTAHDLDVPLPLTAGLFEIMQALKVGGHMDDDHAGLVQYFEQLAGVTVESDRTPSDQVVEHFQKASDAAARSET